MEKIIYNKLIPLKGFKAMALWPFIFIRLEKKGMLMPTDYRHERIHLRQQRNFAIVGIAICVVLLLAGCGWWSLLALPLFFLHYGLEWLIKLCITRSCYRAYRSISTEREAYVYEHTGDYLSRRKIFAWFKFVFKVI